MVIDINALNEKIKNESQFIPGLLEEVRKVIMGQEYMVNRLLLGLLTGGHILLEGVPGLAKTLMVKTLASAVKGDFCRIQFTPDLLPADIVGTMIYNPQRGDFNMKKGPVFANFVLADEINRSPGKVQSALLEAMQEHQVTIGGISHQLPIPFLVLATQNPIEQQGTYPLPEAQVDRFMLKIKIDYPKRSDELKMLNMIENQAETAVNVNAVVTLDEIIKARAVVDDIYVDTKIKDYILDIVLATRDPAGFGLKDLKNYIQLGASPRASIYLMKGAKALAFINGRGYVTPEDIKEIGHDVLRHRIIVTYEAEAEELTSEHIINKVFDTIEVP